jgi:hypothetical protein
MHPSALISRRPAPSLAPIVAIRPSMIPMSARKTSDAVDSVPLRTTTSYSAMLPPGRSDRTDTTISAPQASDRAESAVRNREQRLFPAMPSRHAY